MNKNNNKGSVKKNSNSKKKTSTNLNNMNNMNNISSKKNIKNGNVNDEITTATSSNHINTILNGNNEEIKDVQVVSNLNIDNKREDNNSKMNIQGEETVNNETNNNQANNKDGESKINLKNNKSNKPNESNKKTKNNNNNNNNNNNKNNNNNSASNKKNSKNKKKVDKLDLILNEFKNDIKNVKGEKNQNCNKLSNGAIETNNMHNNYNNNGRIHFDEEEIREIKKKIILNEHMLEEQDNSSIRLLKNWPQVEKTYQTNPPSIPLDLIYGKDGKYPVGEILEYNNYNLSGQSLQEKKEREKLSIDYYEDLRKAAECHRQVRKHMQAFIKPGKKMIDIAQETERKTKELILAQKLKCGWGFPTGCSLNHCAAHYTPNYGDETVLKYDDVCKLDFGVHVNGYIIDCAFTIAFNDKYDNLIKATQDGTNTGLKEAGIDARMCDIGEAIQEAIESYEIELNQKIYPIKAISNLRGHSINKYIIHGGKCVPIVKQKEKNEIMEEGELFAIETFASTGKGFVNHENDCSHYMRNPEKQFVPIRLNSAKTLLKVINDNFDTLPFCNRWLDDLGQTRHFMALKTLIDLNIVEPYPPLCDIKNSFTSQMEHTILLRPTCKEILSRGPDF
ncbi:methionine aminopeptidase 2 [Plasmodium sp. gorilla clade G2]|uniref:methionine aminopeptidase 2 n=1 Tax=Plasmodium sp. gorilla clade G2 TaxID=880535 RepID=UPI000D20A076|nr:methionine aminopeptidase 2 [Plasmodium sp. gorilla clade G2]SOV19189.1 methionine aminopeptidase 2 [Plasmodium sp. gorilla clade G2]